MKWTASIILLELGTIAETNHFLSKCSLSISSVWLLTFLPDLAEYLTTLHFFQIHDGVIKWKQFLCYWPFVEGIHRSPVNSPHKGQWRGALMFCLICAWTNGWVNNRDVSDLRRHRAHDDVTVMYIVPLQLTITAIFQFQNECKNE